MFFDVAASDRWYFRFFRDNILPILAGFASQFGAAKEFLFPMVSQISLDYPQSSLSQHQHDREFEVKAGDRMPYFLVDGANVYDKLRAPKFHLIAFSDGEQDYQLLKQELETEYGHCIEFHVIPLYPRVVEIFGSHKPFMVLLRPDHYIALFSLTRSLDELRSYFKQVIGL